MALRVCESERSRSRSRSRGRGRRVAGAPEVSLPASSACVVHLCVFRSLCFVEILQPLHDGVACKGVRRAWKRRAKYLSRRRFAKRVGVVEAALHQIATLEARGLRWRALLERIGEDEVLMLGQAFSRFQPLLLPLSGSVSAQVVSKAESTVQSTVGISTGSLELSYEMHFRDRPIDELLLTEAEAAALCELFGWACSRFRPLLLPVSGPVSAQVGAEAESTAQPSGPGTMLRE